MRIEAASSNRYSLIGLEVDDATLAQLVDIARHHCKLVLEHGNTGTTTARRREIIEEIETLRCERESIISQLRASQNIRQIS